MWEKCPKRITFTKAKEKPHLANKNFKVNTTIPRNTALTNEGLKNTGERKEAFFTKAFSTFWKKKLRGEN